MVGLTKQHFNKIAEIIKDNLDECPTKEYYMLKSFTIDSGFLNDLVEYFQSQNHLFNKNQFLKACLE